MSFYKFTENDLFVNQLETHPHCRFDIYNSKIYYNNKSRIIGAFTRSVPSVEEGHISLYELNVDRNPEADGTGMIFPFVTRDGSKTAFKLYQQATTIQPNTAQRLVLTAWLLAARLTRYQLQLQENSLILITQALCMILIMHFIIRREMSLNIQHLRIT